MLQSELPGGHKPDEPRDHETNQNRFPSNMRRWKKGPVRNLCGAFLINAT